MDIAHVVKTVEEKISKVPKKEKRKVILLVFLISLVLALFASITIDLG